jgi:sterol desaturase/sphingolipid hydroxylase (fatty acid hydroxylase superfamily)
LGENTSVTTYDRYHYLHHKYFECNYGLALIPLDKWFGTFHDGTEEADKRMNERFIGRSRRYAGKKSIPAGTAS